MKDSDIAIMSSITAFVFAQITKVIEDGSIMSVVTAITAVSFCITSLIKMINYIMESIPKWKEKWNQIKKQE